MATKILPCTCKHPYQDKVYGKGRRVHNDGKKGNDGRVPWRCTVCGQEKLK